MLQKTDVFYFSPTGGTKKVADMFARTISEAVHMYDIGIGTASQEGPLSDVVIVAVPVFGGRIPEIVAERLKGFHGAGKHAVTLVVYGNRAYEDALLELNDVLTQSGFKIAASGAFVAQHSLAEEIGLGRPDKKDFAEIQTFAENVLEKIEFGDVHDITVPGNYPYKEAMQLMAAPISLPACNLCGKCRNVCPVNAITIQETLITDPEKCMLCMACASACPEHVRILPPPLKEKMEQMLGAYKDIRRENEVFQ